MIVAVNQPYWIPYLGYFVLIGAADTFVPLTSPQYSRKSFVARNILNVSGSPKWNSIPLKGVSQSSRIRDLEIDYRQAWREKTLKSLSHTYKRTELNDEAFAMVEGWLSHSFSNLSELLLHSLRDLSHRFGFSTRIVDSDEQVLGSREESLNGQSRIVELCSALGAKTYLNLPSGSDLYEEKEFLSKGIRLSFLHALPRDSDFETYPYKSVLSLLMEVGFDEVKALASQHIKETRERLAQ